MTDEDEAMDITLSSRRWIARYCSQALRVAPGLKFIVAARRAIAAYPYCSEMQPEMAAELFVRV